MKNLVRHIQNTANTHSLWKNGDSFIVGVSGGPDSTCLFSILSSLAKKYDFSLHIAHVNYRLRGKDSDKDELHVRALAEQHAVPITVYAPNLSKKKPSEEDLRAIRYAFFEKLRKKLRFSTIAVGHTRNDQAETVLLHVIRGCGLNGLAGMRPKNGYIIRPLIETRREDVLQHLSERNIIFRTDRTNFETVYTRNTIRNNILPALTKINPNILETLATLAENASLDYRYIQSSAQHALCTQQTKNRCTFSLSQFQLLDETLQNEFLRQTISALKKNSDTLSLGHIKEVKKMLRSDKNKKHLLKLEELNFVRKNDTVSIMIKQP